MSTNTSIEWCHHTFNPVWGCMKVSAGCAHCYAESQAARFGHNVWGPASTTERRTFGPKHWAEPLKWNRTPTETGERRRVFCGSMCDVFEDHPTVAAERAKLWPLIRATPNLDWLLLTKRPERITANLPDDWGINGYHNVWLGTSVESNDVLHRVASLVRCVARVRFLSCEPLLGPVYLRGEMHDYLEGWDADYSEYGPDDEPIEHETGQVDWVIAGGESGPGARPVNLEWLRMLRDDCAANGTPFFLKQLGGHPIKHAHELAVLDGRRHVEFPPS